MKLTKWTQPENDAMFECVANLMARNYTIEDIVIFIEEVVEYGAVIDYVDEVHHDRMMSRIEEERA